MCQAVIRCQLSTILKCKQFLRKAYIDRSLTVAQFQILLAFKLLNQKVGMPPVESNKAKKWATDLTYKLRDHDNSG